MSDSRHNVYADFYGRDRGLSAELNRVSGGMTNVQRMGRSTGDSMGYIDKQVNALKTTMRYAFAGEVVQRIRMAYQNLMAFQEGLANIAAIGSQAGSVIGLTQTQIDGLGVSALKTSAATATSAADILDTYRSLYSSLQNLDPGNVSKIGELATRGARISETDPRTFIQALITQMDSFGQPQDKQNIFKTLTRDADMFFTVIQRSVNLTGDQLANFYGRVTASAKMAGLNPAEMNALIVQVSRGGGSAGFFTRNLAQLLMRLPRPTGGAVKYYERAGLTELSASKMNGLQIIQTLMTYALKLSGGHQISQQQMDRMRAEPGGNARLQKLIQHNAQLALTGPGGVFLSHAIGGRMQSLQSLAVIAPQAGEFQNEVKAMANSAGVVNRQFNKFMDQDPLQAMTFAMQSFTVGLVSNMDPLFRAMRRPLTWLVTASNAGSMTTGAGHFNARLQHAVGLGNTNIGGFSLAGILEGAVGTGLAATLIRSRLKGGKGFGLGLGGNAVRGVLSTEASLSALRGVATGTPQAPYWVVIDPLSWKLMPPGSGFGGGGGSGTKTRPFGWFSGLTKSAGATRAALALRGASLGTATTLLGAEAPALLDAFKKDPFGYKNQNSPSQMVKWGFTPTMAKYFMPGKSGELMARPGAPAWVNAVLQGTRDTGGWFGIGQHDVNPGRANKMINDIIRRRNSGQALTKKEQDILNKSNSAMQAASRTTSTSISAGSDRFNANMQLDINVKNMDGKVIHKEKRKGVQTTFWKDGASPPLTRGKQSSGLKP